MSLSQPRQRELYEIESNNLTVHVALCAERFNTLTRRLRKIEIAVWTITTLVALGQAQSIDAVLKEGIALASKIVGF